MRQYELWWAELPRPLGRRPVLLLSRTPAFAYLNKVSVVEITSTVRSIPQEVILTKREGMEHRCVANFDNLHVVPKASLVERIGALPPSREGDVKRALGYALDWPEMKLL